METEEDKKILMMLGAEANKIQPSAAAFSAVLEKIPSKKAKPVVSRYFNYFQLNKRVFAYAGTVALIALILIVPKFKNQTANKNTDAGSSAAYVETSPTDVSDAAIDQDLMNVDSQMDGLNSDTANLN